jgi:polysaccharide export outer membrane protein
LPDDTLFEQFEVEPPPGLADNPPPSEVLHAGDVLDVEVVGETTWRREALRLGQDGALSLPIVGPVKLAGLPIVQANARMTESMRRYEKHATVTAWLREPAGRVVTVHGAVKQPGVFPLVRRARLSDAIALAGGAMSSIEDGELLLHGDLPSAQLVRGGSALPVSVPKAMRGEPRHDAYLHPGDIVFVPGIEGRRVTILGEVEKPRMIRYRPGMRLSEALARAGGLSDDADDADVRIVRGSLSRPSIYRASLESMIEGDSPDVVLAPGDVVFVTEHWFASATDVVRRLAPLMAAVGGAALLTR